MTCWGERVERRLQEMVTRCARYELVSTCYMMVMITTIHGNAWCLSTCVYTYTNKYIRYTYVYSTGHVLKWKFIKGFGLQKKTGSDQNHCRNQLHRASTAQSNLRKGKATCKSLLQESKWNLHTTSWLPGCMPTKLAPVKHLPNVSSVQKIHSFGALFWLVAGSPKSKLLVSDSC